MIKGLVRNSFAVIVQTDIFKINLSLASILLFIINYLHATTLRFGNVY